VEDAQAWVPAAVAVLALANVFGKTANHLP